MVLRLYVAPQRVRRVTTSSVIDYLPFTNGYAEWLSRQIGPFRTLIVAAIRSRDGYTNGTFRPREAARVRLQFAMMRAGMSSQTILHRIGARTSTQKTVAIMTTRRLTIRRERARDWPIFEGLELPDDTRARQSRRVYA